MDYYKKYLKYKSKYLEAKELIEGGALTVKTHARNANNNCYTQ